MSLACDAPVSFANDAANSRRRASLSGSSRCRLESNAFVIIRNSGASSNVWVLHEPVNARVSCKPLLGGDDLGKSEIENGFARVKSFNGRNR
jgi:hypothetical protein